MTFSGPADGTLLLEEFLALAESRGATLITDLRISILSEEGSEAQSCDTWYGPKSTVAVQPAQRLVAGTTQFVREPVHRTQLVTRQVFRCHPVTTSHMKTRMVTHYEYDYSSKSSRPVSRMESYMATETRNDCKYESHQEMVTSYEYHTVAKYTPPHLETFLTLHTDWSLEESPPNCQPLDANARKELPRSSFVIGRLGYPVPSSTDSLAPTGSGTSSQEQSPTEPVVVVSRPVSQNGTFSASLSGPPSYTARGSFDGQPTQSDFPIATTVLSPGTHLLTVECQGPTTKTWSIEPNVVAAQHTQLSIDCETGAIQVETRAPDPNGPAAGTATGPSSDDVATRATRLDVTLRPSQQGKLGWGAEAPDQPLPVFDREVSSGEVAFSITCEGADRRHWSATVQVPAGNHKTLIFDCQTGAYEFGSDASSRDAAAKRASAAATALDVILKPGQGGQIGLGTATPDRVLPLMGEKVPPGELEFSIACEVPKRRLWNVSIKAPSGLHQSLLFDCITGAYTLEPTP